MKQTIGTSSITPELIRIEYHVVQILNNVKRMYLFDIQTKTKSEGPPCPSG
jgi:hypothetical protein